MTQATVDAHDELNLQVQSLARGIFRSHSPIRKLHWTRVIQQVASNHELTSPLLD